MTVHTNQEDFLIEADLVEVWVIESFQLFQNIGCIDKHNGILKENTFELKSIYCKVQPGHLNSSHSFLWYSSASIHYYYISLLLDRGLTCSVSNTNSLPLIILV